MKKKKNLDMGLPTDFGVIGKLLDDGGNTVQEYKVAV